MWIHWILISALLLTVQIQISTCETQEDYTVEEEADESQVEESQERPPALPAGLETVDPKELGLSESDIAKYFGNVKQLQTLNLPGSKAQILTVGFDENEKLNLQNFEQLPIAGLEGTDKSVAQTAFKQFQSMYGDNNGTRPGSEDADHLTTLFSQNPKLDVLESLNLIPPTGNAQQQSSSSSSKVETVQDEEKRVDQHIKEQVEQEHRNTVNAHNAKLQQQQQQQQEYQQHQAYQQQLQQYPQNYPQQYVTNMQQPHPNLIPQHPMMFLPPYMPVPYNFPPPGPPIPGMSPHQFPVLPVGAVGPPPSPQPYVDPQVNLQQELEQAKKERQEMPSVVVSPPLPKRAIPQYQIVRPVQQHVVRVRPTPQQAVFHTPPPQHFMQLRPAQPQYVQIRQKGEPRQPANQQHQIIQVAQTPPSGSIAMHPLLRMAVPQQQVQHHYITRVTPSGQVLQQIHAAQPPTAIPPVSHLEMNYAHQSHPVMTVIQNPPEMGYSAFLETQSSSSHGQGQEHLKGFNVPSNEEIITNSIQEEQRPVSVSPQFNPALYTGGQYPQFVTSLFGPPPQEFSTIYKQVPVTVRPMSFLEQFQKPLQQLQFQLQQPTRRPPSHYRSTGTHYQGRHIASASTRNPFHYSLSTDSPAFGTQPPVIFRGEYHRTPQAAQPNLFMMPPEPKSPGFGRNAPRPPFAIHHLSLQSAQQQLRPTILPFMNQVNQLMSMSASSKSSSVLREPKPSMPLIKISSPENAMKSSRRHGPQKFLEEMVHAFENKLS